MSLFHRLRNILKALKKNSITSSKTSKRNWIVFLTKKLTRMNFMNCYQNKMK